MVCFAASTIDHRPHLTSGGWSFGDKSGCEKPGAGKCARGKHNFPYLRHLILCFALLDRAELVQPVCGAWVFCSPWIYGYIVHTDRWINSMCFGLIVMVFSIVSVSVGARNHAAPVHG